MLGVSHGPGAEIGNRTSGHDVAAMLCLGVHPLEGAKA